MHCECLFDVMHARLKFHFILTLAQYLLPWPVIRLNSGYIAELRNKTKIPPSSPMKYHGRELSNWPIGNIPTPIYFVGEQITGCHQSHHGIVQGFTLMRLGFSSSCIPGLLYIVHVNYGSQGNLEYNVTEQQLLLCDWFKVSFNAWN